LEGVEEEFADQAAGLFDPVAEELPDAGAGLSDLAAEDGAGEFELRRGLARPDERLEEDGGGARRPAALFELAGVVTQRDAVERVGQFERAACFACGTTRPGS